MAVTVTAQWRMKCADAGTCSLWTPATNEVKNFSYTGDSQGVVLMKAGRYKFEAWGAQGGTGKGMNTRGGYGAYTSGTVQITSNTPFYIYVGGAGNATTPQAEESVLGGYNGGGGTGGQTCCLRSYGTGGGATDFRTTVGTWNDDSSLRSRLMVAAAGGGAFEEDEVISGSTTVPSYQDTGGNGGGLTGYNGTGAYASGAYCPGTGGNQTAGGWHETACSYASSYVNHPRAGFGYGSQINQSIFGARTGGGSGWYGGGASGHVASAGGGSSYISGHTGSVAVTSTSSSTPKSGCTTGTTTNSCSVSPYGYTFTNTLMIDGSGYRWTNTKGSLQAMPKPAGGTYASGTGHTGNGYARITYLGT